MAGNCSARTPTDFEHVNIVDRDIGSELDRDEMGTDKIQPL